MRHQLRTDAGQVIHLQTTATHLAVKIPGADPVHLSVADLDQMVDRLQQARVELIQQGNLP